MQSCRYYRRHVLSIRLLEDRYVINKTISFNNKMYKQGWERCLIIIFYSHRRLCIIFITVWSPVYIYIKTYSAYPATVRSRPLTSITYIVTLVTVPVDRVDSNYNTTRAGETIRFRSLVKNIYIVLPTSHIQMYIVYIRVTTTAHWQWSDEICP